MKDKQGKTRYDGKQDKFYEMERRNRDCQGMKERYVDWYGLENWDCSDEEEEMY